jgi:hypothetical protein
VASKETIVVEEVWLGMKKLRVKIKIGRSDHLMEGPILSMLKPLKIAWSSSKEHLFLLKIKFIKTQLFIFMIEIHECFFGGVQLHNIIIILLLISIYIRILSGLRN